MKVEIDFEVSVLVHLPSPHLQTEKFNKSVSHASYDIKPNYMIWTIWYGPWYTFWLEWSCFLCLTSWYSSLKTLPQSHLNELLLWVFSWIFKYSGEVVSYPHNWLKMKLRSRKITENSSSIRIINLPTQNGFMMLLLVVVMVTMTVGCMTLSRLYNWSWNVLLG